MSFLQVTFLGGRKENNVTSVTLVNNTAKTIDLSPGAGKRWLFLSAQFFNPDDVQRACSVKHYDVSDNFLATILNSETIAATANVVIPSLGQTGVKDLNPVCPLIIEEEEYVQFLWATGGASTGATDADGLVMQVLEIDI